MIKAILFDMDGVLIDSFEAWFRLFNFSLKKFNKEEVTKDEFTKNAWAQDVGVVAERFFKNISPREVVDFYFANFMKFKEYIILSPNVKETLEALKEKNIKIVLISNTHHDLQRKLLESVDLLKYFDLTIGADEVKNGKPAPDMVLLACKKLNVKPEEAIVVGDTIYDRQAAEAADIKFIGFRLDSKKRIDDLKELVEVI